MARSDRPLVYWKHYAYGYEATLTPRGRAFARARMVTGVPGVHYELVWIYGPTFWRPQRVSNVMTIERMVDRWVACHRDSLIRKMPPDPMTVFVNHPQVEQQGAAVTREAHTCRGCGRPRGTCDRTLSAADRKRRARGWPCYRMDVLGAPSAASWSRPRGIDDRGRDRPGGWEPARSP